jgi:hypothetical protein
MTNAPGLTLFLSTVHAGDSPKRNRKARDILIGKYLLVFISDLLKSAHLLDAVAVGSLYAYRPGKPVKILNNARSSLETRIM